MSAVNKGLYGAIEAGGTKFVCAYGSAPDDLWQSATIPTTTPDETFAQVIGFFDAAQTAHGAFDGFGVASFGPIQVDPLAADYGQMLKTPKPGWTGANFVSRLAGYGAPVRVDSDVNGAGLGELAFGAGRGLRSLAYVTVGTGVGAGVVDKTGPRGGIGHAELGHIRVPRAEGDDYPGHCPIHGDCLEGMACGPAIIDRFGADLSQLGPRHPALALEAHYLSHLALVLILGHMPQRLVFGGGVMKADGLMDRIRANTQALLNGYVHHPRLSGDLIDYIVPPALQDRAGITGALQLAIP